MRTYAERLAWAKGAAATLYTHGATRVFMFGSLGRGGVQDVRSDIDLAVEGLPDGRAAELIAAPRSCRLDVVALETTSPELRASFLRNAVLLPKDGATPPPPSRPVIERRPYLYMERERALQAAARAVRRLPPAARDRVTLTHGLVTWRDPAFLGHDAITAVEVIEHLEPPQLNAFAAVVFGHGRPRIVVLTTPNAEYNTVFGMSPHRHRVPDHRFEWTREQFGDWSAEVAERYGYTFRPIPIGPVVAGVGSPTQLGFFTLPDHRSS